MAQLAALFLLLLGLVACGRGPETDQVRQDLGNRLARAFDPGTFEVVAVDGRGSSADSTGPPGEERRVVYYDARLRLTRDVDFGAWNGPGTASLVTVLGAGPKGIRGSRPAATRGATRSARMGPRYTEAKATHGKRWPPPVTSRQSRRRWKRSLRPPYPNDS